MFYPTIISRYIYSGCGTYLGYAGRYVEIYPVCDTGNHPHNLNTYWGI